MASGTLDHKCPGCSATLKFNPHGQNWVCEYCKSTFTKDELKIAEEKELKATTLADKLEKNSEGMDLYSCPNCGAEIIADENTSATFCVYCKNTAILKNKLVGEFNPSKLIPFYKTREDAIKAFKDLGKGRPLMPKEFSSDKNISEMRGIYIPFWLYDYSVNGNSSGTATKVKTWTTGSYIYTKTDTYSVSRSANMKYCKIPVDGSKHFDNDIMNSIEPYDYNKLVDFSHSYLSGFYAEKYDVDLNTAADDSLLRARNSTTDILRKDIKGYSNVALTSNNHNVKLDKSEYVLLPVWMLNIKYKDKMYKFAMNGETGELIGNIPIDTKKAIIIGIVVFIISLIVLSIGWFIFGG